MRKHIRGFWLLARRAALTRALTGAVLCLGLVALPLISQETAPAGAPSNFARATTENTKAQSNTGDRDNDYRVGSGDLLDISVLEAPELNRSLRVSAGGEVSMPPVGTMKVGGRTPQEIESVVTELLRRAVINDPHVTVFVHEMESHPVSVTGAVKKPGVFHIREPKSLLEMISMAEGLADDAGATVLVVRGADFPVVTTRAVANGKTILADSSPAGPASSDGTTVEIELKDLLNSHDSNSNVLVYPGDTVKVSRAGLVYVLGDVKKPGGFLLKNNENISVLQALALAEGLGPASAKNQVRIIRTDDKSGQRTEIALDLGKIMQGKAPDASLQMKDILFVPQSGAKGALRAAGMVLTGVPGALVYRTW